LGGFFLCEYKGGCDLFFFVTEIYGQRWGVCPVGTTLHEHEAMVLMQCTGSYALRDDALATLVIRMKSFDSLLFDRLIRLCYSSRL